MKWYEFVIIAVAIILVIAPIITYIIKKKKGTLKCECGHYQSECVGNCSSCSKEKETNGTVNKLTYVLSIEGMKCGMCESHINDVIRKNFNVVKVKSSRRTKSTMIVSTSLLSIPKLKESIINEGYQVSSVKLL